MTGEGEYILGTDREELDRLRVQHEVWAEQARALWQQAGFRRDQAIVDLGCGPGYTSVELARLVGPRGKILARDKSASFLGFLEQERDRLGLPQIETSLGPVEELDLPAESQDAAYARWLFCWLEDPADALRRVARSVKPGGVIALQDYLDWGAMKLIPRSEIFDRIVLACMRSWEEGGGTIDIGEKIPTLAAGCSLRVEYYRPLARLGRTGSPEWRWLGGFFRSYLPRLVAQSLLEQDELDAFERDWEQRTDESDSFCYTPTMVDVVLRK